MSGLCSLDRIPASCSWSRNRKADKSTESSSSSKDASVREAKWVVESGFISLALLGEGDSRKGRARLCRGFPGIKGGVSASFKK